VTDRFYPELLSCPTGEQVCADGRNYGILRARRGGFDYVLFLDHDLDVDPDIIQKLLAVHHPVACAPVAARGDAWALIGHNYKNRATLEREPLLKVDSKPVWTVDGASGAAELIARRVFEAVDLSDYRGPDTIPGRFTADDEFLQIEIFKKFGIKPKIRMDIKTWHYDSNGYKYQVWGNVERWR